MTDAKPRLPGDGKLLSLLYSTRTLALLGLFATGFLLAPRLLTLTVPGSQSYGLPLTFERIDRAPPPFEHHEFDPLALLVDVVVYYVAAVAVSAAVGELRRAR